MAVQKVVRMLGWPTVTPARVRMAGVCAIGVMLPPYPQQHSALESAFPLIFGRHHDTLGEEGKTPYLTDFTAMSLLGREQAGEITAIWL